MWRFMGDAKKGASRRCKRWSSAEVDYMRSHAADGPDLVAAHLGRTASSVKSKAQELGVSLCRVPWAADGDLCPRCGARPVRKGAPGWREGLCEACHFSVLSERTDERAAAERERRRYDLARRNLSNERKKRRK